MTRIATYVFLDLEGTGLPEEENNQTKITEMSLLAVKREHLLNCKFGKVPRVQTKLTLCFNPGRNIKALASELSGLTNDMLTNETRFNEEVCELLNNFLNLLTKPVCLMAYGAMRYDFPVLQHQLLILRTSLPKDLLSTDCFHAFFDIIEGRVDNRTLLARRFPWPVQTLKPNKSFKIKDVYERVFGHPPSETQSHQAEYDCMMTLKLAASMGAEFVKWVDQSKNHVLFSKQKPMGLSRFC
ncbi:three prime repair exonuclease 2 isoform X1 [Phthorimaea operculella]|nr:three prime repair exonuclease 2 isoform X1 [Phthorimaea operculella]